MGNKDFEIELIFVKQSDWEHDVQMVIKSKEVPVIIFFTMEFYQPYLYDVNKKVGDIWKLNVMHKTHFDSIFKPGTYGFNIKTPMYNVIKHDDYDNYRKYLRIKSEIYEHYKYHSLNKISDETMKEYVQFIVDFYNTHDSDEFNIHRKFEVKLSKSENFELKQQAYKFYEDFFGKAFTDNQ